MNGLINICHSGIYDNYILLGGERVFTKNKKVILIGDRDGIPSPAMEECVKTTKAEVVFSTTECFV